MSPSELPPALAKRAILWHSGVLWLQNPAGKIAVPFPEDSLNYVSLSPDDRYLIYVSHHLVVEDGETKPGDFIVKILDLQTSEELALASKEQNFPNAKFLTAPTFASDGKDAVFVVAWEHALGLAKVNIDSKEIELLDVDIALAHFVEPDVSQNGLIIAKCKGSNAQDLVAEMCLLA